MFVVAEFKSDRQAPRRLEGNVTLVGTTLTVTHREKGAGKDTVEVFDSKQVSAYMKGEAGFVVANSSAPVAKVAGELITKGDVRGIKTEAGTVILNDVTGIVVELKAVDSESREARTAERAAKVKVRPARSSAAGEARPARAARPAAAEGAERPKRSARPTKEVAAAPAARPAKRRRPA